MNKKGSFLFLVILVAGAYAFISYIDKKNHTPIPTPTPTLEPTPTANLQLPTYQAVAKARAICLDIKQSNPEVEPYFTSEFRQYLEFVLKRLGLSITKPGSACDATLVFELEGVPRGAKYANAPEYCYTGANILGEVTVTAAQGEPITYDVRWGLPPQEGVIGYCSKKFEAPFPFVTKLNAYRVLFDLWGLNALVFDYTYDLQRLIERNGEAYLVRYCCGLVSEEYRQLILKSEERAIPILAKHLEDRDELVRVAAVAFLGALADKKNQATSYLIEMLDDTYRVTLNYKDVYPVRKIAHDFLVNMFGRDVGYDKQEWYRELTLATPEAP